MFRIPEASSELTDHKEQFDMNKKTIGFAGAALALGLVLGAPAVAMADPSRPCPDRARSPSLPVGP